MSLRFGTIEISDGPFNFTFLGEDRVAADADNEPAREVGGILEVGSRDVGVVLLLGGYVPPPS